MQTDGTVNHNRIRAALARGRELLAEQRASGVVKANEALRGYTREAAIRPNKHHRMLWSMTRERRALWLRAKRRGRGGIIRDQAQIGAVGLDNTGNRAYLKS